MTARAAKIRARAGGHARVRREIGPMAGKLALKFVATSEILQLSTEGVEQLEIYFGKYLPQLFYSLLAPLTLFAVLSFYSVKSALILLKP